MLRLYSREAGARSLERAYRGPDGRYQTVRRQTLAVPASDDYKNAVEPPPICLLLEATFRWMVAGAL